MWEVGVPQITEVAQFIHQKKSNDALRLLQVLGKYKHAQELCTILIQLARYLRENRH